MTLAAAAEDYARREWCVFPCMPGDKRPLGRLVPHGLKDATTDLDVIRSWWRAEPLANIALVTGLRFDALDVDGPDALDRLERAGPLGGDDVEGPCGGSPRPGWHVYVAPDRAREHGSARRHRGAGLARAPAGYVGRPTVGRRADAGRAGRG